MSEVYAALIHSSLQVHGKPEQASGSLLTSHRLPDAAFGPAVRRLNTDRLGLTHAAACCGSSRGLTGLFALGQPAPELGTFVGGRSWATAAAAVASAPTGSGASALEACAEESLGRLRGLSSWAMRHMLPVRSSPCGAAHTVSCRVLTKDPQPTQLCLGLSAC